METIARPNYLNHIVKCLNRGMMLFLVGQRRVGKSFLLHLLKNWIEENVENANVLYINMENMAFAHITNHLDFYHHVENSLRKDANNYLLIDEVQNIENFELALRSLYAEDKCQIVATGSNAYIFASELSTHLSGRYIEIPVYALTYQEFLQFHNLADSDASLISFLNVGGLPGLRNFNINDLQQVTDYLQGVYSTVLLKDVIARNNIRNTNFMERLAHFLADNAGKIISVASIYKFMKSKGVKISEVVVADYIQFLCKSLIIRDVHRYNIHGKSIFESLEKYYFSDHGIRNIVAGFDLRSSIEKVIENVVYNHLIAKGYNVTIGILRNGEIDFVASKASTPDAERRIYVQCCYLLGSEDTVNREFGNLASIKDNYAKYVVTMEPIDGEISSYPGIKHINLRRFLTTID